MFELAPGIGWLFTAYVLGTLYGMWFGFRADASRVAEATIDTLIEGGFLKTRTDPKTGEVEVLRVDD